MFAARIRRDIGNPACPTVRNTRLPSPVSSQDVKPLNFMKNIIISGMSVFALALLAPQTALTQGTMFLSSLGQPATGSAEVGSDSLLATEFRTGNNPGGYVLDSVQLAMAPASGAPSQFTVMLYSGRDINIAVVPGSSLGILSGSSDPVTSGLYTYTASGLTLSPSTDYYVVLASGTLVSTGFYAWSYNNSPPVTSGGWGGSVFLLNSSDGSSLSWNAAYEDPQFSLTATAVPEPGTLSLLALAGLLSYAWPRWRAQAKRRTAS